MAEQMPSSSSALRFDAHLRPWPWLRSFCEILLCSVGFCKHGRRRVPRQHLLRGGVEDGDLQYGNARCLSSYYSVFVARLAIMVMLAILIGMLTILTWHFTRVYTTKSINSLAYGLRYELLQRPILRMWNILNSTVEVTVAQVKLSQYVIGQHTNPDTHAKQAEQLYEVMRDITWALFSSRKFLNAITISYGDGHVQAFHRDHKKNNTYYMYSELTNLQSKEMQMVDMLASSHFWRNRSSAGGISAIWYKETLDPITGKRIGLRRQVPPDDIINIAGISAIRDGAASWHVTVSKFTDSPLLSAALPVRYPIDGSIAAVVGVTTTFFSVGQLMRELVEFHSGYIYLTSQEGYLLATSTDTPLLRNTTTGPKLMMAVDSQYPIIRSGAGRLQKAYGGNLQLNHEIHMENVILQNQRYYLDSFFLNLKRLPLVGVIIIPRSYVMGKVDQRSYETLVILISASLCILLVGCVCIMILTSGVSKEMKLRAELISHLDARRRAEASNNYKSQFLANMSHELRTPMAAVIGLLDILMCDDCLTNEQVATISQIHKCSTALLRLLNNILDLSKVESGKLVLEDAEFDLERELEGLVDMFSVQCIDHNVEIVLDLADDMPKLVRGDSARVVQIFANLISNSIKFTSSGHLILRGWTGFSNNFSCKRKPWLDEQNTQVSLKKKVKQHGGIGEGSFKRDDQITLWFEVDDTGCGIIPSKWESVFESFEQADPSTTRMYGGTGLGLCIVRTLVNKMGGQIKVVKKDGPGTLMQLYLVFGAPVELGCHIPQKNPKEYVQQKLMVILALNGNMGRITMSRWLRGNGIDTHEASDWKDLMQILCQTLEHNRNTGIEILDQSTYIWKEQLDYLDKYSGRANFAWILNHDTSNNIKMELRKKGYQLMVNWPLYKSKLIQILETVSVKGETGFARKTNDRKSSLTSEAKTHERDEIDPIQFDYDCYSNSSATSDDGICDLRSCAHHHAVNDAEDGLSTLQPTCCKGVSSDERRISHMEHFNAFRQMPQSFVKSENMNESSNAFGKTSYHMISCDRNAEVDKKQLRDSALWLDPKWKNSCSRENKCCLIKSRPAYRNNGICLMQEYPSKRASCSFSIEEPHGKPLCNSECSDASELQVDRDDVQPLSTMPFDNSCRSYANGRLQAVPDEFNQKDCKSSKIVLSPKSSLQGLTILLAEDTPVLQRVATIMLEKMGATVLAVGDGQQAVDALRFNSAADGCRRCSASLEDGKAGSNLQLQDLPVFDLILMDCQMPRMDGYEATKAIRRYEAETGKHIPIVALTAHAMSSDEAKCLEVGMDAYLTKPIDSKQMVSTILSLVGRVD
ncbi:histidine kinase 1 isoform X3 [Amborella trichopoda]|uniref:histidine kinase 1 isoform X3 n=1 Tax=Amborella trichopoda TaxID=13333 RepID=UPI0009C0A542|nr:histidine kinase 1 isoform X3 [Amborella trichopoda]|eukprot:XP_020530708.1 histidine kinase 1 isoform X3 [Amborella trichopoda]